MNRILAISVALACLTGAAAYAQDDDAAGAQDDDFSRGGFYLGLAGTVTVPMTEEGALEEELGSSADVSDRLGIHARGGLRGKWAAIEVHYEWLGDSDVDGSALTFDGKLYFLAGLERKLPPLARRFQPFVTVGLGYVTFLVDEPQNIDEWAFAVRSGGGLDVYLTRNIAISIDATYLLPVSATIDDLDYLSVGWGVLFRF